MENKTGTNFYTQGQHPARDAKGRYPESFKKKVARFVERQLTKGGAKNINQAVIAAVNEFNLNNREAARTWHKKYVIEEKARRRAEREAAQERFESDAQGPLVPDMPVTNPHVDIAEEVTTEAATDLIEIGDMGEIAVEAERVIAFSDAEGGVVIKAVTDTPLSKLASEWDQIHDEITGHMIVVDQLNERRNQIHRAIEEWVKEH